MSKVTKSFEEFMDQFKFNRAFTLKIGVERECHLTDLDGNIVPIAPKVLEHLWQTSNGNGSRYGYELSACQLEERTDRPCDLSEVLGILQENEREIVVAEKILGFKRVFLPVAPADMPLVHYPVERYDDIVPTLTNEALMAACRVTGVHVHIGMPDHETALVVYNAVIRHFERLCRIGYTAESERLTMYGQVLDVLDKTSYSERMVLFFDHLVEGVRRPPPYKDWGELYERAVRGGFTDDPRRLWDFIRISHHGTIEFRMFDTVENLNDVLLLAIVCHSLCKLAMENYLMKKEEVLV